LGDQSENENENQAHDKRTESDARQDTVNAKCAELEEQNQGKQPAEHKKANAAPDNVKRKVFTVSSSCHATSRRKHDGASDKV
jgi:hypothetical protein